MPFFTVQTCQICLGDLTKQARTHPSCHALSQRSSALSTSLVLKNIEGLKLTCFFPHIFQTNKGLKGFIINDKQQVNRNECLRHGRWLVSEWNWKCADDNGTTKHQSLYNNLCSMEKHFDSIIFTSFIPVVFSREPVSNILSNSDIYTLFSQILNDRKSEDKVTKIIFIEYSDIFMSWNILRNAGGGQKKSCAFSPQKYENVRPVWQTHKNKSWKNVLVSFKCTLVFVMWPFKAPFFPP